MILIVPNKVGPSSMCTYIKGHQSILAIWNYESTTEYIYRIGYRDHFVLLPNFIHNDYISGTTVWEEQAQTMISFENYCLCLSLVAHHSGREACCSFLALDLCSKRPQLLIQQTKWEARGSWWQFKRWQKSFAFSTKWSLFSDPLQYYYEHTSCRHDMASHCQSWNLHQSL